MSTVESITKYIVAQRLANNEEFFCVLQHVIKGYSPSNIAELCNVTKNVARSYIYRIVEKSSSSVRALIVAKHVLPFVLQLVPTAVLKEDGRAICMLCNTEVDGMLQYHIASSHADTVNYYTRLAISKLREKVLTHS